MKVNLEIDEVQYSFFLYPIIFWDGVSFRVLVHLPQLREKTGKRRVVNRSQEQQRGGAPNGPDCLRNFQKSLQFFELTQVFLYFILHWFNTKRFSANTFSMVILHKELFFVVLKLRYSEQACLLTSTQQTTQQNTLSQWSPGEPRMWQST